MSYSMRERVLYVYRGKSAAPRRFVTMNGEPIQRESHIRHSGNLMTHDLSDLNDIAYKKVSSFLKLTDWTRDFPLFQVASKSPITNLLLFLLWVPDLIWETCQLTKCRMEQGRAANFKSAIQNLSAVPTFDSQWKIFQSQHCSRLHKCVNGFSLEKYLCFFHWCQS